MNVIAAIKGMAKRLLKRQTAWHGNFDSWQEALSKCSGYSSPAILEKVTTAAVKVKKGEAVYERDSVLFDSIEYSWPLVAALLHVAGQNNNTLKVIDFGGSLGSSYYQNKSYLAGIRSVEWNVIEQPAFVEAGRRHMQDDVLRFYGSIEECIADRGMSHLLLSACTLPYIEQPYQLLEKFCQSGIPFLMIDNTFFNYRDENRITVQTVSPNIYNASYPCWFLSYQQIVQLVRQQYHIISEHNNTSVISLDGRDITYRGFLAKIK